MQTFFFESLFGNLNYIPFYAVSDFWATAHS